MTCLLVNYYFFLKGAEITLPRGKICVVLFFLLVDVFNLPGYWDIIVTD